MYVDAWQGKGKHPAKREERITLLRSRSGERIRWALGWERSRCQVEMPGGGRPETNSMGSLNGGF
jgi:hypothetical protein